MPERKNDGHVWIGAANVPLPSTVVRLAFKRGTFRLKRDAKVAIIEVSCKNCRQEYSRCAGRECSALKPREERGHLAGGPVGDQRRRRGGDIDSRYALGRDGAAQRAVP